MKKTRSSRLFSLITAFMLVISLAALLPEGWLMKAGALTYTLDGTTWTYEVLEDDTLAITAVKLGEATIASHSVTIPNYINGKKVTVIGAADNATNIFGATDLKITNVILPANLTTIGDNTFNGCSELVKVETQGKQISMIGSKAFYNCKKLNDFYMPSGIIAIGDYAFANCVRLPVANMPNTVRLLGKYAFSGCTELDNVTISNNIEMIPEGAFKDCKHLNDVTFSLGSKLRSIGKNAFCDCDYLGNIDLPDSLVYIYDNAFYDCNGLRYVILPEGVRSIGKKAFADCNGLEAIYIPEGTTIKDNALSGLNKQIITVYGYTNSYADIEADELGYKFVDVDELLESIYKNQATIYTVISDVNGNNKPYLTLSTKNSSGGSISGLRYNAAVTITPLNIPANKNVGHYKITTRLMFNDLDTKITTNDWEYTAAVADLGTTIYTGAGIGRLDKKTLTEMIRQRVSMKDIAQCDIIVSPVFEEKGMEYGLTVAGKKVTDKNCADVFGDGVFSYNNKTKTLIVNGNCDCTGSSMIVNSGIDGLVINIAGDSRLTAANHFLVAQANTTLTGNGKLTVKAQYAGIVIHENVKVTIKDTEAVSITNEGTGSYATICDNKRTVGRYNSLIIDNANITLTNKNKELKACGEINTITLVNSKIVSPKDAYVNQGSNLAYIAVENSDSSDPISAVTIASVSTSQRGKDLGEMKIDLSNEDYKVKIPVEYHEFIDKILDYNSRKAQHEFWDTKNDVNRLKSWRQTNGSHPDQPNLNADLNYSVESSDNNDANDDVEFSMAFDDLYAYRRVKYNAYGEYTYEMSFEDKAAYSSAGKNYYSKLVIIMPDTHIHDGDAPTYKWSDDCKSCTASVVCQGCGKTIAKETVKSTFEIAVQPTCTEMGSRQYTATFTNSQGTDFRKQTKTVKNIPATGHTWGKPTYKWTNGKYTKYECTATARCTFCDAVETEEAEVSLFSKPATTTENGVEIYTATFKNKIFETQTKKEEIPKLSERIPGDVNDDGEVNVKDVTLLKQYLAKWNVNINVSNADVDGQEGVTVKDLTVLKQYLAKWKVTLK